MAKKPKPPSDMALRRQYMEQARFMTLFWSYRSAHDYHAITSRIFNSQDIAGGPALRLANAIWDFEYALKFPRSKVFRLREEASFSRLVEEHRNTPAARRYHVWNAMEMFIPMREQALGTAPLSVLQKEDLCLLERQDLVRAFWLLHEVQDKEYVAQVIKLLLTIDPRDIETVRRIKIIARAIHAFEQRKDDWKHRLSAMKSLLRQQWVRQSHIGDAISIFEAELNQRLSPA